MNPYKSILYFKNLIVTYFERQIKKCLDVVIYPLNCLIFSLVLIKSLIKDNIIAVYCISALV